MPRDRAAPPPLESAWLERSLDRHLAAGVVFMLVLVAGFGLYRVREPSLRADATRAEVVSYTKIGTKLFKDNCKSCHGANGEGDEAPTLNAKEFLEGTTDTQTQHLVAVGIPGTDMSAWGLDFGGALTDEQIAQIVTYMRSWEKSAPSVPNWREGGPAAGGTAEGG